MGISLEQTNGVGVVALHYPPANAYNTDRLHELADIIAKIRRDDAVRVVVVRSALEKFFSAGADISVLETADNAAFANLLIVAHETMDMITHTPKIFIAAVAGHCIGGGLELALACDLRFGAEGKYGIGLGEINLGLNPAMGGTQRLPRLIRRSRALQLMVTGETIKPDIAHEWGILDRLSPADVFWDEVMAYAEKLAKGPSLAQGYAKLSLNEGLESSLAEGLTLERAHQNLLFTSEDATEGVKAFLQKRPAQFKGR
jgi:enoyl-CoA hydratase/carnithine racemase